VIELCALRCEVDFELCFDPKILVLGEKGSLAVDAQTPGHTTVMNHTRDVVWLGFKPREWPIVYARPEEGW
jgi:hypothetical protein